MFIVLEKQCQMNLQFIFYSFTSTTNKFVIRKPCKSQDSSPIQDSSHTQDSSSKHGRADVNNLPSDLGQ